MLEQPDLPRQRRLCHMKPLGGAAEMQFFGDGDEAAEVAQFDTRYKT